MLRASPCLRAGVVHDQPGFPATPRRWSGDPHGAGDDVRRRYAAGDADAVRAVYAQYAGPMLTAALHVLGGDRRLAEEAVQLAMLKAWRAAASFDPTRPLSPWLYAIVRRCAIDIARKEQRHRVLPLDHPAVEPAASEGDGLESATSAWAVREALGTLPATEYTVVRLSYYEGLTHAEIARRLTIPIGTVKSRSASAHRRLRAQLGLRTRARPATADHLARA